MQKKVYYTFLTGTMLIFSLFSFASFTKSYASSCYHAIELSAKKARVPAHILAGIALTETGRSNNGVKKPWPWAINANGRGYWMHSKQSAIQKVKQLQKQGIKSIDVGCMQINLKWHKNAFSSLEQAFDPVSNTRYAARFLKSLRKKNMSWLKAAGHYHSKTEKHARKYRRKLQKNIKIAQKRFKNPLHIATSMVLHSPEMITGKKPITSQLTSALASLETSLETSLEIPPTKNSIKAEATRKELLHKLENNITNKPQIPHNHGSLFTAYHLNSQPMINMFKANTPLIHNTQKPLMTLQ